MRKKRTRIVITRILEAVALLFVISLLLLQNPGVQTRITDKAIKFAEKNIDADIHFSSIKFAPFTTLIIKDLAIIDRHPRCELDTVMAAKQISATFSLKGLLSKKDVPVFDRVRVKDFTLNLVIFPEDEKGINNNISSIFMAPHSDGSINAMPDLFRIKKADIDNFHYRMVDIKPSGYTYPGHGINWVDLELWADAKGHDINFTGGGCSFDVDWVRINEKCGYSCMVTGHCTIKMGVTNITDTHIVDKWSNVYLKHYSMTCKNAMDFSDFLNKVSLEGDATAAPLSLKSISYFCGIFKDSPLDLDINSLKLKGPIASCRFEDIDFKDRYSGLNAHLSGITSNIFNAENSAFELDSHELDFTPQGLEKFISGVTGHNSNRTKDIPEIEANLTGKIDGSLNDINASVHLNSTIGSISLEAGIKDLMDSLKAPVFKGNIIANHVDLAQAGLGENLGKTSARIEGNGILMPDNPTINIDNLEISELTLYNYPYSKINGSGYFKDNTFTGNVKCNDPNLNFIFGGSFSLSPQSQNSIYKFNLILGYADLVAMNIDKLALTSSMSAILNINLRRTNGDVFLGDATISNFTFNDESGKHNIGDILFASVLDKERLRINLRSAFADFSYAGDPYLSTITEPVLAIALSRPAPSLFSKKPQWDDRNFDASFYIKDTKQILQFLHQDIYIASGTQGSITLKDNASFDASFTSQGIRYGSSYLKNIEAESHSNNGTSSFLSNIKELEHNNVRLQNAFINAEIKQDKANVNFSFTDLLNKKISADMNMSALFSRNPSGNLRIDANTQDSKLTIDDKEWNFSKSHLIYEPSELHVHDLTLSNATQYISIEGGISKLQSEELTLKVHDLDLSLANILLSTNAQLSGLINGHIKLSTPSNSNAGLDINLSCPNLGLGKTQAGALHFYAFLDDEDDLLKFSLTNGMEHNPNAIKAEGTYNSLSDYLNARLSFNSFNPQIIQPTLSEICSTLDGSIDGKITATGQLKSLTIRSNDLTLNKVKVGLIPTGVNYTLNGKLRYDETGLLIDKLNISDPESGKAELNGNLSSLSLHMDRFSVLNKQSGSSDYYGKLALNGDIHLNTDTASNLLIDANISNAGSGKVSFSVSSGTENSSSLLEFTKPETTNDEEELKISRPLTTPQQGRIEAKCRININPGLEIAASLDKEGNNALNIAGEGVVTADINSTTKDLVLGGNYNITEGKYHFSALSSLISKDFNIEDGSSLTFAGNVMDTELNINAKHSLKASLGPLISDTTSISTRRLVNCGIKISDKLRSPSLKFSIDIPDLDPTTKNMVDSELNTEDKVSRQFLSLIVLGGFLPGTQSGITNTNNSNSNFLFSNLTSIMSGQLNAVLQKFGIPLDLGLSYQQNEVGNDVMDVAVSTQLFDNMVSVNGSLGNRKFSSTSDENMVGDLDINIKLNKSGHFRLNLFSHSADDYTNYLDNSQRNGIGISYQKEYDDLRSFIKSLFRKKEDKESEFVPNKTLIIKNE